jgi:hypothetical protein
MAGAVGIVFGLCVLSFTLGAAVMYVVVRRREEAAPQMSAPVEAPAERTWVEKPATVEPVDADYDTRPIHRNPVVGLPQVVVPQPEPVLVTPREPEPEPELVPEPEPEVVVETTLPPQAEPQPVEQTTWVEREDFRQRYLRTFDEVRRKAGSN